MKMKKYHVWTEGCQMNVADSQRVAVALERLGYESVSQPEDADVIVVGGGLAGQGNCALYSASPGSVMFCASMRSSRSNNLVYSPTERRSGLMPCRSKSTES